MTFTGTCETGLGLDGRLCSLQTERAASERHSLRFASFGMTGRQRIGTARAARKDNVRVEAPRGVIRRVLARASGAEVGPSEAVQAA